MTAQTAYSQNPRRGLPGSSPTGTRRTSRPPSPRSPSPRASLRCTAPRPARSAAPVHPRHRRRGRHPATGGASAATAQTLSGSSLDGVVGVGELVPPRPITPGAVQQRGLGPHDGAHHGCGRGRRDRGRARGHPQRGQRHGADPAQLPQGHQHLHPRAERHRRHVHCGLCRGRWRHRPPRNGVAMYDAGREPEAYPIDYAVPCVKRGRCS